MLRIVPSAIEGNRRALHDVEHHQNELGCGVHRCSCTQFSSISEDGGVCSRCHHGAMYHNRPLHKRHYGLRSVASTTTTVVRSSAPLPHEPAARPSAVDNALAEADQCERIALMKCVKADNMPPTGGNDTRVQLYKESFKLCVRALEVLSNVRCAHTTMDPKRNVEPSSVDIEAADEVIDRMRVIMRHCDRIRDVIDATTSSEDHHTRRSSSGFGGMTPPNRDCSSSGSSCNIMAAANRVTVTPTKNSLTAVRSINSIYNGGGGPTVQGGLDKPSAVPAFRAPQCHHGGGRSAPPTQLESLPCSQCNEITCGNFCHVCGCPRQ